MNTQVISITKWKREHPKRRYEEYPLCDLWNAWVDMMIAWSRAWLVMCRMAPRRKTEHGTDKTS